ncbi:hypothetical protein Tco_0618722 [Tanacetum coccineum]
MRAKVNPSSFHYRYQSYKPIFARLLEEEENEEVEEEASKDETKIQVDAELTQDHRMVASNLRAHAEPEDILVLNLDILALASLVVRLI